MAIPGLTAALVGAGADILGGLMGNMFSSAAEGDAFSNQASLMQRQFELNREMMNRRHQWEVWDLKEAGLNPILSALNGAPSMASTGLAQMQQRKTPEFDFSKAANALASSALAQKQTKLAEYNSQTERIKADADMIRARQEEAKTQSAIELNQSQSTLNLKTVEMADKNFELQKIFTDANVREIDQRIINSVAEVTAKVKYYADLGSAAQTSAAAAMRSADAQAIIAHTAEENGISQRALNDALSGKASAETKEAVERASRLAQDIQIQKSHNPIATGHSFEPGSYLMSIGEILRNGIGGSVNMSIK